MAIVDVIDSIKIAYEGDPDAVLAEWSALDSEITTHGTMTSGYAVKLYMDWSDQGGAVTLHEGDYFTFDVPDIFKQGSVGIVDNAPIKTSDGDIAATYSIYDNSGIKQVKITFTDYVETHTDISGTFWLLLYIGMFEEGGTETIEFIINNSLAASGDITVAPPVTDKDPHDEKFGHSAVADIFDGYYIFNWTVYFNMEEDPVNGFNVLDGFSFEDLIPQDSPHVFLTDDIRQRLGLSSTSYPLRIGEYLGADEYPPEERYALFESHYNSYNVNLWTNKIKYFDLVDGYSNAGIDGGNGIDVSNLVFTEKLFSADLGRITRPTAIQYCTYATVKIAESALGDKEVVKLFENTFKANYGEDIIGFLDIHYFGSGGTAQGIEGECDFWFTKVDENDNPLEGVIFYLFTKEHYDAGATGADRVAYSGADGVVKFEKIPDGIYYFWEAETVSDYILDGTIYKAVVSKDVFDIFYGENFIYDLRDKENKITNTKEVVPEPAEVELMATKSLTGTTLSSGMFSFIVKDSSGTTVATGTNDGSGVVKFSKFELDKIGIYTYTVTEIRGTFSGITYDASSFTVTVTVTNDGSGILKADIAYPQSGVTFNNSYAQTTKKPCVCPFRSTKCRKSIAGQKIWIDNDNASGKRPATIEIKLLRDGAPYKNLILETDADTEFVFCCLPIMSNQGQEYFYEIAEATVEGYSSKIDGYNVINTLLP